MHVLDNYIEGNLSAETAFNHVALEAAIRAVEDDYGVPPYIASHRIDLRAMGHVESIAAMRELLRAPGFELDLNVFTGPQETTYSTPYERSVKRGWSTNHFMVESSKGWLVFDLHVDTRIEKKK
ncbi:hypothetical protein D3C78_641380 [compost metagenome]